MKADDQPLQDVIDAPLYPDADLIENAIWSSLANFTLQVTKVLDNKLGEIKEQLVSNKSLQSGSYFCNQNGQQPPAKRARVDSDRPVLDDYNTHHDTHSGGHVHCNCEVDQDSISVHAS